MQKYRLVFKNNDTNEYELILLKGIKDYEENVEICFIDLITTKFDNESSFIDYLKNKNVITSTNGSLALYKPNGTTIATQIIYNNNDFKLFSKQICEKKKFGKETSRLTAIHEQVKLRNQIINFIYNDENAHKKFKKTFFTNKKFANTLDKYLEMLAPVGWSDVASENTKQMYKNETYSMLQNYEILRNAYLWIEEYKKDLQSKKFNGYYSNTNIKNPYEEYEKKKDL